MIAAGCALTPPEPSQSATAPTAAAGSPSVPAATPPVDAAAALVVDPVGTDGKGQVTATFSQPAAGRPVELQRQTGETWETVATQQQDASGAARFAAPSGVDTYRAVADAFTVNGKQVTPVATAPVAAKEQYHTFFSDDFTGKKLNSKVWSPRMTDAFLPSRVCSASTPKMLSLKDGNLLVGVRKADAKRTAVAKAAAIKLGAPASNPCPHGAYDNGHVSTQDKLSFTYGVVAVRMKMPALVGEHGAAWLQSYEAAGGELDFLESFGLGKGIQYKIHVRDAAGKVISSGGYIRSIPAVKTAAWWDQYHIGSLEWTKDEYIFRVDGQEVFRTSKGVSSTQKYLILSLLTSDWELPSLGAGKLPSWMAVDWVRIYQR